MMPGNPAGHSTNLIGVPTGLLASATFNDFPLPLHISGVRETNRHFFEQVPATASLEQAARLFQDYMNVLFGLDREHSRLAADGRRRYRASYLRLLKGWGFDANSQEGAVLKGWVESRFGLFPTFHKTPLTRFSSPEWATYVEEKMSSRFHNNSISLQLDLLYEFCQWAISHRLCVGRRHLTLYRGANDFLEHPVIQQARNREAVIRMNNLVSFTAERSIADEFGDYILEARVPTAKILFFNELLPHHPLKGEAEYLVIGGDYKVKVNYV